MLFMSVRPQLNITRRLWTSSRHLEGVYYRTISSDPLSVARRLFVPVEEGFGQYIFVIDKKQDGSVERKKLYGVRYVPLTDAPKE